jgi:hypothetical protein
MTTTSNLGLPLLAAAQAQKHVTHNEALSLLDAVVQLSVRERDRDAPPGEPIAGDRYLVGSSPTGVFAGNIGRLASFNAAGWHFCDPKAGWLCFISSENHLMVFDGTNWRDLSDFGQDPDSLDRLGVGTTADDINRLAVKSNAALFTASSVAEFGTGDLRIVLNKSEAANVLSQLYQTGYQARAECGLVGSDDFSIRVSSDGSTWRDAVKVDNATGYVTFPSGAQTGGTSPNLLFNPTMSVNQRGFIGGALGSGFFGFDRWRGGPGGCSMSRSGETGFTLSGTVEQVVEAALAPILADVSNYAGRTLTISVDDPTEDVQVAIGSVSAVIKAGSGRRSAALTLAASETGNLLVRLQTAKATFLRRLKLEHGGRATPWAAHLPHAEEALCKRYFQKLPLTAAGQLGAFGMRVGANAIDIPCTLPVSMRDAPVVAASTMNWSAASPLSNQIAYFDMSGQAWVTLSGALTIASNGAAGAQALVLRLTAGTSFSGASGSMGILHLGNRGWISLNAELA